MNKNVNFFIKGNKYISEIETISQAKYNLSLHSVIPILEDNNIMLYKCVGNNKMHDLYNQYHDTMFDIDRRVMLKDDSVQSKICNLLGYDELIACNQSAKEEMWEYFGLNDELKRNSFLEQNRQEIEVRIPINEEIYVKGYKLEKIDEVVERMAKYYVTYVLKKNSKLAEIVSCIGLNNYFDLSFIASTIYDFLYSENIKFSKIGVMSTKISQINNTTFTNKEKNLSVIEKLAIIKDIISALNIECIYSKKINEISGFDFEHTFGITSKDIVITCAKENAEILYNSEFSKIYEMIVSSNNKSLIKRIN